LRRDKGKEDWFRWGETLWWIGLMHGHFPRKAEDDTDIVKDEVEDVDDAVKNETIHTGISIVVPVAKILEVLNQPEVVQLRRESENEIQNKNTPVMD
ncbi:MAG: hypothetical protein HW419_751, partial [Deltaproteobacteria bacterium]|nr:hypothetical protein [Deltaproteobacteria bacterium]